VTAGGGPYQPNATNRFEIRPFGGLDAGAGLAGAWQHRRLASYGRVFEALEQEQETLERLLVHAFILVASPPGRGYG
jgi:hypothetical protein